MLRRRRCARDSPECVAASASAPAVVAVVAGKGWEQVAAVLGVLRAGCAYLPINAQQLPQARVEQVLMLGDAVAVATDASTLAAAPWLRGVGLPLVDVTSGEAIAGQSKCAWLSAALASHPLVAACRVRRSGADGALVASVVPRAAAADGDGEALEFWAKVYDGLYADGEGVAPAASALAVARADDASLDFAGWQSTFTGGAISRAQMVEWRQTTVDRVLALKPKRVIELGFGTGLLTWGLVPHLESYDGTDLSAAAVERARAAAAAAGITHAHFGVGAAHEVAALSAEARAACDLVLINSVVHYFPNANYLHDVVSAAVALLAATADGGVVVVGDVRCLRLLGAFHRAVQAYRNPEASAADVAGLADAAALSETQLCVHPHWWASSPPSSPPSTAFVCCRSAAPPPTSSRSTATMSSFTSAARAPPSRRRRRRAMSSRGRLTAARRCARASPMRSAPAAAPSCAACQTAACSSTAARRVPTRGRWRRRRCCRRAARRSSSPSLATTRRPSTC